MVEKEKDIKPPELSDWNWGFDELPDRIEAALIEGARRGAQVMWDEIRKSLEIYCNGANIQVTALEPGTDEYIEMKRPFAELVRNNCENRGEEDARQTVKDLRRLADEIEKEFCPQ